MSFNLSQVKSTKSGQPPRTLIYGDHKVGKSTFAACSESPIFIQTEDGCDAIDVQAFPFCRSWENVLDCVTSLYQEEHKYKNVVIDSVDWLEQLAFAKVCADHGQKNIEKVEKGFGKGYLFACDLFRELLDGLKALRETKNMGVILLCHCEVKHFDDPVNDSYDRYQLKLSKPVSKLFGEWCDVIGFASMETITKLDKTSRDERTRAVATGQRVLKLVGGNAFLAGNRYGLPDSIPLIWSDYQAALDAARK